MEAFLPLPDQPAEGNVNAARPAGVGYHELDLIPELSRVRSSLAGAGDGLHNNPIQWDANMPPIIIVRRTPSSTILHYMPLLLLISSCAFKCLFHLLGIDTHNTCKLGISYSAHFTILQGLLLLATYWFKSYRR